jgi:hypothetical protein
MQRIEDELRSLVNARTEGTDIKHSFAEQVGLLRELDFAMNTELIEHFRLQESVRIEILQLETVRPPQDLAQKNIRSLELYEELYDHKPSSASTFSDMEMLEISQNFNEVMDSVFVKVQDDSSVPIVITFMHRSVTLDFNCKTTFSDLSVRAARYFGLPASSVNFINDSEEVMPDKATVAEVLLPWGDITFRAASITLNIVLTKEGGFQDSFEPLDKFDLQYADDTQLEDTNMDTERSLHPKTKVKLYDEEIPRQRKKLFWGQLGGQIVAYICLIALWLASRANSNIPLCNSMTQGIHKLLTSEKLSSLAESSLFSVDPSLLNRVKTRPDLSEYLTYLETIVYCVQFCIPYSRFEILPVSKIYSRHASIGQGPSEFYEEDLYQAWPDESTEDAGYNSTYSYSTPDPAAYIKGFSFWYRLEGLEEDINTSYNHSVTIDTNSLIVNGFINQGTRVVFLSLNFYNPNVGILYPVVALFQIDAVQSISVSVHYKPFFDYSNDSSQVLIEAFIVVTSCLLAITQLFELTFLQSETSAYLKLGQLSEQLIKEVNLHAKQPIHRRLRKPTLDEFLGKV